MFYLVYLIKNSRVLFVVDSVFWDQAGHSLEIYTLVFKRFMRKKKYVIFNYFQMNIIKN